MAAVRPRKAKPVAIRRCARLAAVLDTRYQMAPATSPTITTCQTMARSFGSAQLSVMPLLGGLRPPAKRGSEEDADIDGASLY